LAEFSGGEYFDKYWMYTEEQVAIATEKKERKKSWQECFWPELINSDMATCYQSYKMIILLEDMMFILTAELLLLPCSTTGMGPMTEVSVCKLTGKMGLCKEQNTLTC
jgi:hypothetical protein